MRDRRELPRAPLYIPIEEECDGITRTLPAVDICELGMRYLIPANGPHTYDREVFLRFRLPGSSEMIQVLGRVAGQTQRRTMRSVTFMFLDPGSTQEIRSFVTRARAAA